MYLPGILMLYGEIAHDISRILVISHPISYDITTCDMSRYCVHIPNVGDRYGDIAFRRDISRYRTLFGTPNFAE